MKTIISVAVAILLIVTALSAYADKLLIDDVVRHHPELSANTIKVIDVAKDNVLYESMNSGGRCYFSATNSGKEIINNTCK